MSHMSESIILAFHNLDMGIKVQRHVILISELLQRQGLQMKLAHIVFDSKLSACTQFGQAFGKPTNILETLCRLYLRLKTDQMAR